MFNICHDIPVRFKMHHQDMDKGVDKLTVANFIKNKLEGTYH